MKSYKDLLQRGKYLNKTIDETKDKMIKLSNGMPPFCDEEKEIINEVILNLDHIKNSFRG